MSLLSLITITHGAEAAGDVVRLIQAPVGKHREANLLIDWVSGLSAGVRAATLKVGTSAVQASGTLTLSTNVATDTAVVNGVTFTAVASGATGNQWNVGGSDTISATNLAAAINASVTAKIPGYVVATSLATVVTVTAVQPGLSGNMFTLAATGGVAASGAKLTGGDSGTEVSYNYGT